MVRGHPALDGRDRSTRPAARFAERSRDRRARQDEFGRVQDVAGQLPLEDLALRSVGVAQVEDLADEARGIADRDQVVRRRCSFPGPRGTGFFAAGPCLRALGPFPVRCHPLLRDPLLKVGALDSPAVASAT
jgi:hypothetical protein